MKTIMRIFDFLFGGFALSVAILATVGGSLKGPITAIMVIMLAYLSVRLLKYAIKA